MRSWLRLCLVGLILTKAQGVQAADSKVIKWGVETTSYYPQYSNDAGVYLGFAADLFKLFAEKEGYKIDYSITPIKRLYLNLFRGEIDLKYPDNDKWQPDQRVGKNIIYSDPVVNYIDGCVVLKKNLGAGKAKLKKLGTVAGFTAWEYFDDIKSGAITVMENDSFTGLLKQLLIGRIDCAYINVAVARYQLEEVLKAPGQAAFDPDLPHTKDAYHLSTINRKDLIDKFNAFMKREEVAIKSLKEKFKVEAQ